MVENKDRGQKLDFYSKRKSIETKIIDKALSNYEKRLLYSEVELLRLDIEESSLSTSEKEELYGELDKLIPLLKLAYIKRRKHWADIIDEVIRSFAVCVVLIFFGTVVSIPMLLVKNLDYVLVGAGLLSPFYQFSEITKMFVGRTCLAIVGIFVTVEGVDATKFGRESALVMFSHASTLDAFIVGASLPMRGFAVAKRELLFIPFFNYLLLCFGAVPIDRENRHVAVESLKIAANSARMGDCVVVAPEGTRSTTGQLLPFKKGPFHLWETLGAPVVPVVIYGAYDLFPPGKLMTIPGKVYIRYLKAIHPSEVTSREHMSRLVRRRMLEALLETPQDTCAEITPLQRGINIAAIIASQLAVFGITRAVLRFLTVDLQLSYGAVALGFGAFTVLGTAAIITYYFYIMPKLVLSKKAAEKEKSS